MGLLPGAILSLHEQRGSFVWIGTTKGLQRFDGVTFKTYFAGTGKRFLPSPHINDIESVGERYLYVGTKEGFARLDTWWDTLALFNRRLFPELPSDLLHDLLPDGANCIWLAPDNRNLTAFDPSTNLFTTFPWKEYVLAEKISSKTYLNINQLLRKNADELWLLSNIGVFSFHKKQQRFQYHPHPEGWIREFTGAYDDGRGNLWVSPGGAGLYCLNHITGKWQRWMTSPDVQPLTNGSPRYNVLPFGASLLLVATVEGLGVFDLSKRSWHIERHSNEQGAGLPKGHINQLYRDHRGGVWIGADGGLARLDPLIQQFRPQMVYASPDTYVSYVLDANDENVRYIAPRGPGALIKMDKRSGEQTAYFPEGKSTLEYVSKMVGDKNGNVWILDFHRLLFFDKQKEQLRTVSPPAWLDDYGLNIQFQDMCLDSRGNLWISSMKAGFMMFNTASFSWERIYYRPEISDVDMQGVCMDKTDGSVWFGSRYGRLCRYFPDTKKLIFYEHNPQEPHSLASNMAMDVDQTHDGSIWAVTEPGGVSRFDRANNRFDNYFITDGLPVNLFRQVLADRQNRIWLLYDGGICLFDPMWRSVQNFDHRFGIAIPEWGCYMSLESDGTLLMGAPGGFLRFHPDSIGQQLRVSAPALVSAQVMFDEMLPVFRSQSNSMALPHNRNFLTFHFSTFNYTLSSSDRYQYQLEGYDNEWIAAQNPLAAYPNLPPGKYRFRARVESFDHNSTATSEPVSIEIRPHFSQTLWFRALLLGVFLLAVYAIYRYRIQQSLRIQSLRNKIAGDLHDDVASTVSSISFYSYFAKKQLGDEYPKVAAVLEKIGDDAREALDHMRDIVWAIRIENDEYRFMRERMQALGQSLCTAKGIAFEWVETGLNDKSEIPLALRKNLFLIYKESLNNALKYAECRHIQVNLEKSRKHLSLQVQDDGKGFDPHTVPSGTGLRSLQARAAECHGKLSVQSSPGEGTAVSFWVKIP